MEEKVDSVCGPTKEEKCEDMLVHNVWLDRMECLVDFVVTDPNQPSYWRCTQEGVPCSYEQRKKHK